MLPPFNYTKILYFAMTVQHIHSLFRISIAKKTLLYVTTMLESFTLITFNTHKIHKTARVFP